VAANTGTSKAFGAVLMRSANKSLNMDVQKQRFALLLNAG